MSIRKTKKRGISDVRMADPYLERELTRYPEPLPSREYILQILTDSGQPTSFEDLCHHLDISLHEIDAFARRLQAMEREGELLRNRKNNYLLPEKVDLIAGRVEGHSDGFGFLRRDDNGDDIFLDSRQMTRVLHGDKVLVRIVGKDRRGKPEGVIVEVTERANRFVVGRILVEHGVLFVVPENRRIGQDILIPQPVKKRKKGEGDFVAGQVVVAEITEPPTKYSQPIGRITEILGSYTDPGMEIEIALRKHELPFQFSEEAVRESESFPAKVRKTDRENREDLTSLPLLTIDGETARDFDDAVFCERIGPGGRNFRLVVAIADVAHYVKPGSALDREAYERGNSVYFPRRVIPMLPEALSNGLCSLNPNVERLAMVCDMEISSAGNIRQFRFYPAVFVSHARLTYTKVWNWLSKTEKPENESEKVLLPHLENLHRLYKALHRARQKRGAIDFETVETSMIFNEQSKIERIEPVVRNDAHKIIEECMLAANVCASEFLEKHKQVCLYRVHEGPTPEKLERLREFLKDFNLTLNGDDDPRASDYAELLSHVAERPDRSLLQTVMLRSLRQAIYTPDNLGHFGLAYDRYTHFTSPIRRYPDLLVHRAIKAVLAEGTYTPGDWESIGLHCSMTERRADDATRDVTLWLKCFYLKDRIGDVFTGTIASVVPFGLFVNIDEIAVEGLIHVSELGRDYFIFDDKRHELRGERTGECHRLGNRVSVRLVRVDMENGKIDFLLAEMPDPNKKLPTTVGTNTLSESKRVISSHGNSPLYGKKSDQSQTSRKTRDEKHPSSSRKSTANKKRKGKR